jgi:hypothetical protein
MGCPVFSFGLARHTRCSRFLRKIPGLRLEQSSAAELFVLGLRVDVACWRFGLLELGGQDRLAPAFWDIVGHAAIWPTQRHSPLRSALSPWRDPQP